MEEVNFPFEEPDEGESEDIDPEFEEAIEQREAEQAEFNERADEFLDRYGFKHECHCAEDWAEGNLQLVSVCYLSIIGDALDELEKKIAELKEIKRENARLRIELADSSPQS